MKSTKTYLIILVVTIVGFVLVEMYRPEPTDWSQTFSDKDKIPYGSELLYKLLTDVFPNQKITDSKVPFYSRGVEKPYPGKSNYLYVYQVFRTDSIGLNRLMNYVSSGNQAFIAAEGFEKLGDSLHIETDYAIMKKLTDSLSLSFSNPQLGKTAYPMTLQSAAASFSLKDSSKVTVLGRNSAGNINFIRIPFGKGFFYLHSVPAAFTNYYLVKGKNAEYAFRALSYLPVQETHWDEFVNIIHLNMKMRQIGKSRSYVSSPDYDDSPLRFIVSQPALRWAYYLSIFGLFLYVVFEAKRRQRIIPLIEAPANASLEFVETIGQLYFKSNNHKNIAGKKISHFLAFIRTKFFIRTIELDQDFRNELSIKSGVGITEIDEIFDQIDKVSVSEKLTEKELLTLNERIEGFYKNSK